MAFIGNTPQNQSFAPAIDYFSGNGVTVTFTLSRPVVSVAQLTVAVDNVIQNPSSAFTVSGNSITFTSAPLSGTNNIWVEYTSLITTYAAISQDPSVIGDITATGGFLAEGDFGNSYIDGTIVDYVTGNARITTGPIDNMTFYHGGTSGRSEMMELYYAGGAKIFGTTALTIPVGTTAERPGTPAVGMTRYNTTLNQFEVYQNGVWLSYTPFYSVDYLVIAGGGGAGSTGGGGGAGGYLTGSLNLSKGTSYTVTVGAGGAGSNTNYTTGSNGTNSVFGSITTLGGGGGGSYGANGASGGSGGGGGNEDATALKTGGAGTSGQGNAGGNGVQSATRGCGGGGGAGAVGATATAGNGGNGGAGLASSITGSSVTRAGGGGGNGSSNGGTGGSGGGGNGGKSSSINGTAGSANTGGGGGGSEGGAFGGAGGSGVVILSIPTSLYSGTTTGSPTVTTSGSNTILQFNSSGSYTA